MDDYNTILESARLVDSMPSLINIVEKVGDSLESRRQLAEELPDTFFKTYRAQIDALVSESEKLARPHGEDLDEGDLALTSYFFACGDAILHHGPLSKMTFAGVTFMLWYKSYQDDMSFDEAIYGTLRAWETYNDSNLAELIKRPKTIH